MSALTLTLRQALPARLDLRPLSPLLAAQGPAGLAQVPLLLGRERVPLADLFTIEGDDPTRLVLQGDLQRVDGIGAGLRDGSVHVAGHAGAYLGLGMQGGGITVEGDAGHFAAVALRKGQIEIHGSAGDYLGGILPGAMQGMAGGLVMVRGNVGARCGDRMRRGAILVEGHVGDYAGSRMLAGTIVALSGIGAQPGYGMRRGTLMVRGALRVDSRFADCGTHALPIVHLLFRSWQKFGGAFAGLADARHPVQRYLGDRAADGKGELLHFA